MNECMNVCLCVCFVYHFILNKLYFLNHNTRDEISQRAIIFLKTILFHSIRVCVFSIFFFHSSSVTTPLQFRFLEQILNMKTRTCHWEGENKRTKHIRLLMYLQCEVSSIVAHLLLFFSRFDSFRFVSFTPPTLILSIFFGIILFKKKLSHINAMRAYNTKLFPKTL